LAKAFERLMGNADVRDIAANDIARSLYKRFSGSEMSIADG